MSFATKLCHIVYADGKAADVMKQPQTDTGKFSLPGASKSCLASASNVCLLQPHHNEWFFAA